MWESSIYRFEKEVMEEGKIIKKPFSINVTYSVPRSLPDPGKALMGVFNKITQALNPNETKILRYWCRKIKECSLVARERLSGLGGRNFLNY